MAKRGVINVGKNTDRKSKKNKNKKIKTFLKKLIFYCLFLGFLAVVVWALFFSDFLKIKNVVVVSESQNATEMKEAIEGNINKKLFGYIPKNNLILISKNKIISLIKNEFRLINSVSVEKKFPRTISVKIIERQNVFIWCNEEECFLVDETGLAFYQLDNKENNFFKKDWTVVFDKSNKKINLNEKVISPEMALFCYQIIPALEKKLKIKIKRETFTSSPISGEITLKTEEGWEVYLNTSQAIEEQVEILRKFFEEDFISEKKADLDYIDLRLKGKVVYRFRNDETDDATVEEEGNNEPGSSGVLDNNNDNKDDKNDKKD